MGDKTTLKHVQARKTSFNSRLVTGRFLESRAREIENPL